MIPNLANPQSLNRFAYAYNSPINFNDPSGHCSLSGHEMPDTDSACVWASNNQSSLSGSGNGGFVGGGQSVGGQSGGGDPDTDLTKDGESFCRNANQCYSGEGMKALYDYYSQNSGWWNHNGIDSFTLEKFLGMMLMYELNQGTAGEDYLIKAAILQIWGDSSGVGGHGPYCSSACENGVFNFLAAYVQSAQKRYDSVIRGIDSATGKISDTYDIQLDQPCCWDSSVPYSLSAYENYFSKRAADIGFQVLNPNQEDTIYTQDKPYHWGNYTKAGSIPPFFNYGDFYIFSTAAHNSAIAAGGSLVPIP